MLSFVSLPIVFMDRDFSVGIATVYELGGLEIESRWGRDYPHWSLPAPGPTVSLYSR